MVMFENLDRVFFKQSAVSKVYGIAEPSCDKIKKVLLLIN